MRLLAIPALLLLALAGLAVSPPAAAAPPAPPCNGTWATTQEVGPATVFVSPPCYHVDVEAMSCPISGSWKEVARVHQVVVRAYTCDRPDDAEPSTAMAPPCTCPPPPQCRPISTVGPVAEVVSVTLTSDCRIVVSILPRLVACGEPLDGSRAVTVGRLTVVLPCGEIGPCEPPLECYPESSAALPPYCRRVEQAVGPVYADVGQCFAQVVRVDACTDTGLGLHYATPAPANEALDAEVSHCWPDGADAGSASASSAAIPPVCIEREAAAGPVKAGFDSCRQSHEDTTCSNGSAQRIHYYRQVGPVYAQVHFCFPHSPPPDLGASPTTSDTGPCGFQQRCPAPYPPCTGLSQRLDQVQPESSLPVWAHADLWPSCRVDLYVKADVADCLWTEGYNKVASQGPLTVYVWGCQDGTTAQSTQMPPCTCPPPQPPCYHPNRAIAWGDHVQVDDWCNVTVNLEADCGLQGTDQHQLRASKVTVNYQTCQPPPQE
jgi:hypothetical protein